ncbi:DNA-binding transcriptional regulator, LysR family [Roseovarius pacificus]|uniref:DNA-binding transcriptional regulator, LysR family n=1 Tax=Roseovarius pacificus TaxID=337701 RepID=A0A1M6WI69_9RHOB|nr:LysR family transcriptional regulator [Roseovarius pacificus]GGO53307.1 transcriptional regulator [Roseovarius pacificus]SHK93329.1 DNA-binding transcriptional regulator, LysR family [Roseovarius pacificus]
MNLSQLSAFREVMLCGTVSQAARNLGRTQPAISTAIASLEDELGMPLFERRSRRLHPVPEAHYLLAEATEIIGRMDTARENLQNLKALTRGELRLVAMPGPSVFLLPRLVSQLTHDRQDIHVTILTRSSPQVHQLISTQSYDLGIADLGEDFAGSSQLVTIKPTATLCLCAVPADDPLASKPVITPEDLNGRPMATLNERHATYRDTKDAFHQAGAVFRPRFQTQYFIPLLNFVELGEACAVVDVLSAESYRQYRGVQACGIAFRPFEPKIEVGFNVLTPAHRPPSHLASAFTEMWIEEVQRINAVF